LIKYLYDYGLILEKFIVSFIVQLLCRVTKISWYKIESQCEVIADVCNFLQENNDSNRKILGILILKTLVHEMNRPITDRPATEQRKIAVDFRETCLLKIFQLSINSLKRIKHELTKTLNESSTFETTEALIELSLACLGFDFVGATLSESVDEIGTIQVPSAWRQLVKDYSTIQVLLKIYFLNQPPMANKIKSLCLECLTIFSSVRRSIFSSDKDRLRFISNYLNGTLEILRSSKGSSQNLSAYYEFCRLLSHLKTNFQLLELMTVENYPEWFKRIENLTIESVECVNSVPDILHFLLEFWSRVVY
jgi:exportin-7